MLLLTLLIIFSAIVLRNIRYGAYLIIFSMPLYLWRFSVLGIPTTALEIMIYILFLAWITNSLKSKYSHTLGYGSIKSIFYFKIFSKTNFVLNIGIILLFLGVIISTAFSSDIKTSLGILKGWFFDPFLFFIVFVNVIKTEKEVYSALKSWLASGIAVSVISIFYLLSNDLTFDGRLYAFFLSPNHLAMYISMPFLITLGFLISKASFNARDANKKIKIGKLEIGNWKLGSQITNYKLPITALIIILIPLYFTYSYGAFLGLLAGALYLLLSNFNISIFGAQLRSFGVELRKCAKSNLLPPRHSLHVRSNGKNIYRLGFMILLFFGLVFLSSSKFNQIINSSDRSSFHSRLMIWSSAGEIIKDNPLFGIGPGTFQETYLSYADKFSKPYLEWAVPQPHNIFLAFYLQTGLIGFAGFILVLFWFFQSRRHSRIPPAGGGINNIPISLPYRQAGNILISLMIYILVHGLVDTTYWKNDLSLMFWLIIGGGLTTFEMYAKLVSSDKNESNLKTK